MDGRQRTVMTCVHGLQHVECLAAAHLAYDDSFGAHTEAVSNQVPGSNFAFTLYIRWSGLQTNDVRLLQLQLGGIFDRYDPLAIRYVASQNIQYRRLSCTGAAGDKDIQARLDNGRENLSNLCCHRFQLEHVVHRQ